MDASAMAMIATPETVMRACRRPVTAPTIALGTGGELAAALETILARREPAPASDRLRG
jgi:hypothetical protein